MPETGKVSQMATATERPSIRIISGALDETPQGDIVLRGVVRCDSLVDLQVDAYQREAMDNAKVRQLQAAITSGGVPDIVLGMRGQDYSTRENVLFLRDDVFIIDGLQRVTAAMRAMQANPELRPHLGATIHFDTTKESEQEMFEKLNLGQTRLSPNVTLRNFKAKVPAVMCLHKLSEDKNFVLYGLVSWDQNMKRGQLITANTFIKTAAMLHSHAGPGRTSNVADLANGLGKIHDNIGRNNFIQNTRLFFEVVDSSFGIRRVTYKNGASFIKTTFLLQLAKVMSDHTNFWDGDKLVLDARMVKKIAAFPITDPQVVQLCSSGGSAGQILYMLIVDHINHGKRTGRLVSRRGDQMPDIDINDSTGYNSGGE